MGNHDSTSIVSTLRTILFGKARDVHDPQLFHRLSLIAFFAWIGLGVDGLSSSNYGPEETFLALGHYTHLGIFVALAMAVTIFVITASYSQIVELFPTGGGGYLVASKLLSPALGMVSGSALLIDYLLTITISIASGADALFSFLPLSLGPYKLLVAVLVVLFLTVMNMRGVKESVVPLVPVFLIFLITHTLAIIYAVGANVAAVGDVARATTTELGKTTSQLGVFGTLVLIMRSYSMGAGTYTGIEAVSNGMPLLRDPKVQTAKRTLRYMAFSLAFTACGLMVAYLLYGVVSQPGKTLNAVVFERITAGWGTPGYLFYLIALISEAILLFTAAQTGFLGGPRVLANMSLDRWLPSQFSLLSERLVTKNGLFLMGSAAVILMMASGGSVGFLVTLYAINVFITFTLSQAGMVRHWWQERRQAPTWSRKILVSGVGFLLSGFILISQLVLKFSEGGWITILITGTLVSFAFVVKRFYTRTGKRLARLDSLMTVATQFPLPPEGERTAAERKKAAPRQQPRGKTAVILVSGFNGTGLHTLFNVRRVFGDTFRNWFFIEAGIIDADRFKGPEALQNLTEHIEGDLAKYVGFMRSQGLYARGYSAIGTDVVEEISGLALSIYEKNHNSIFFGGQIVFQLESFLTRLLYNHTTFAVQRRLHQDEIPFFIMPVRVD